MNSRSQTIGIEINPTQIGALFTSTDVDQIRLFCYYTNGTVSQFDMPAEENMENLRQLFDTLKMEPTCTSLILPEAVQGRVFINKNGQDWLYTILKSPGQVAPPLNSDIANQDWQRAWKGPDAEILYHTNPNGAGRSYAIRSEISSNDAARLMQSSRAFSKPVSPRFKTARNRLNTYLLLSLIGLSLLSTATACYRTGGRETSSASVPRLFAAPATSGPGYYLLYAHRISGPFPAKVVTDLVAAGLINNETMCRADGASDWTKVSDLVATAAPAK